MRKNPNTQKQWRVRYKLITTNDPTQETVIQASEQQLDGETGRYRVLYLSAAASRGKS